MFKRCELLEYPLRQRGKSVFPQVTCRIQGGRDKRGRVDKLARNHFLIPCKAQPTHRYSQRTFECIGTITESRRFKNLGKDTTWDERRDEGAPIQARTSKVSDLPWLSQSQTTSDAIAGDGPVPSLTQITPSPKLDVSTFCSYTPYILANNKSLNSVLPHHQQSGHRTG